MNRHLERGNALWFILIAIVLLGALTVLVTRGGSSVDQSGDVEQMRIKESQIMRYAKGIETAIQQMKLRGVSENQISFESSDTGGIYANAACTVDDCKVFDIGGGQAYAKPPVGVNDGSEWIFTASNNVGTGTYPVGTSGARSGNDIVMLLANTNTALCTQINRDVGIGASIPQDTTGIITTEFTGTFDNALMEIDGDPTPFELDGHQTGCFTDTNANPDVTYFYYVILAR